MGESAPADICDRLPGVNAEGFFRQCLSIFSEACRRNGEAQQPAGDTDGAWRRSEKCKGRGGTLSGLYGYQGGEGCVQGHGHAAAEGNILKII